MLLDNSFQNVLVVKESNPVLKVHWEFILNCTYYYQTINSKQCLILWWNSIYVVTVLNVIKKLIPEST